MILGFLLALFVCSTLLPQISKWFALNEHIFALFYKMWVKLISNYIDYNISKYIWKQVRAVGDAWAAQFKKHPSSHWSRGNECCEN